MSKTLHSFVLLLFGLLFSLSVLAQDRTVTGTVTGSDNKPVAGATVRVKGTTRSVQTDENGRFTISASSGQTLQISHVGLEALETKIGDGTVNARLRQSDATLGEVVVTAMDIRRNSRELGYSAQRVGGDEIKESQRENFINSLQGRVAGATVTQTSGAAGSSSSIVLRGFNSLSMSNQPLFVIDGVIVDNQTIDENSNGGSGVGVVERGAGLTNTANKNTDYTNRISDINPNDIESITVLKGPEATALYGSQAASGAIIITTRKAKSNKLALQYDNAFRVTKVTRLPDIIDSYSTGTNGDTSSVFRYYGPAYPAGTQVYDNLHNFFRTGFSQTHNLGADFGVKNSIFRVSGSLFDQKGVIPYNDYKKYNARISNTTKIGNFMDITPSLSYIRTENDKVLRSAGGYLLSLLTWPGTLDIRNSGDNATKVPLFANSASPNAEFDNPLFSVKNNKSGEITDRYNASLGVNINPTSWLTLAGRFGYETYNTEGWLRYHPLSYYITVGTKGLQDNFWRKYNGYNHTLTATAKKSVGNFNFRLMAGQMWQDYKTQMFAISGTGYVDSIVRGVMYKGGVAITDANYSQLTGSPRDSSVTSPATRTKLLRNVNGEFNESMLREVAYFGEFSVNYKNMIFLSYTHRFEQASTLPERNRNFNYPGMSVSIIASDLLPGIKSDNGISYWKFRGSVARTAKLNSPYSTQSVFVNSLSSGTGYSYGFFNNNADLLPEKQQTFEIGTEVRLLKSRLSIDATYYNTLNKDLIVENFRLSYATGFVLNTQNAGSIRNKGIEVSIDYTPVRTASFTWNTKINFNKGWNKVEELPKNVPLYYIADANIYGSAASGVVLGGSSTTISGLGYMRNNNGDILISPLTGIPVIDGTPTPRGDRNPNFTIGWNNALTYKNWRLSMLWDIKVGGDIYNGNDQYLVTIGKSPRTADRETPRVIKGVLQDGLENTATPTVNTIAVTPYYYDSYYRNMPEEEFIEKNVNWFRLRDATLSYNFPSTFVKRIGGIKSLGAFITANDLILLTNYSGADPAVNANTAGTRGVGGFGFDYGTLPAQLSLNFGIKASF